MTLNGKRLDCGDSFPALKLQLVSGETLGLPAHFSGCFIILLFYRGDW